ncbi:hypothetical protein AMK27_10545 [Streptomyces sp. CB02009]|uniref:hypothetical protein n=1 Tax=Streptomyces sp. CB02009 TaxID=1703938 RepID=UPI0009399897|nr:hypothetical protein [Streptomyces sp. CB02009]OKJ63350.1 hypothetical protein AMK27_10545 [Streptomyces sp. CB02009]
MHPTDDARLFTSVSARLTGFDGADLEATGMAEVYRAVAAEQLGPKRYARLLRALPKEPADAGDPELRKAAEAVTYLWYTGSWPGPPPFLVSPRAYTEGLVWKAAGLKAPGTAPGGYGSWAEVPDGPAGRYPATGAEGSGS